MLISYSSLRDELKETVIGIACFEVLKVHGLGYQDKKKLSSADALIAGLDMGAINAKSSILKER